MTTQPNTRSLAHLRSTRVKRLSHFVKVDRIDGTTMRWTDHDRAVTLLSPSGERGVYRPASFVGASVDSQQATGGAPSQRTIAIIDGDQINIPDLVGQRYRGARVQVIRADWRLPWLQFSREVRRIRSISWDDFRFVAQLDGLGAKLERKSGGRFGGVMTYECPYVLGGEYCGKDISGWSVIGGSVSTIHESRSDIEFTTASWPTAEVDEFYRYGEVEWLWSTADYTGTLTATSTSTRLTETGALLTPDAHIGKTARIHSGGAATPVVAYATITGNDANGVDFAEDASMAGYPSTTTWDIAPPCDNVGFVTEIARYTAASRRCELFVPTPFAITSGDSGIIRVGCDGLFTTCDSKFSNPMNFGGVHIQPEPGDQWEVTV